jgi:predicted phosphoribosyltransferase
MNRAQIMPDRLSRGRRDAGRFLAGLLDKHRGRPDGIDMGLSRGGVPVAYEVGTAPGAHLDVFLVGN